MYRDLIVSREQGDRKSNPLLPRVLEFLFNYRRVAELTKLEMLQLYQINQWIDTQIEEERLPALFQKCIPEKVATRARDRFSEYDATSLFPEEQMEVAKKLLKLRVTFAEDKKIKSQYRVDVKQLEHNNSIYLYSSDPEHKLLQSKGAYIGVELIKQNWLRSEYAQEATPVKFLCIEDWKSMNKMSKFQHLVELSGAAHHQMKALKRK